MKYFILSLVALSFLSSCQNLRSRGDTKSGGSESTAPHGQEPADTTKSPDGTSTASPETPLIKPREAPRIGFIIGAGGAKVMAAVGVLKEIQRLKIPVHAMSGIEFGAFAASVFAKNKLANEVEWQFSKIDSKSFSETQNADALNRMLGMAWSNESLDSLKAVFACSSLHIGRQQNYVLAKGNVKQALSYCLPYPPLFKPFDQSVADVNGTKALADFMRSRGANYIIFINVLASESKTPRTLTSGFEQVENITWVEAAAAYKAATGADFVLNVNTDGFGLLNFDKKKELMATGQDQAKKMVQHLQEKFGL